jgi:hypothetical protein
MLEVRGNCVTGADSWGLSLLSLLLLLLLSCLDLLVMLLPWLLLLLAELKARVLHLGGGQRVGFKEQW